MNLRDSKTCLRITTTKTLSFVLIPKSRINSNRIIHMVMIENIGRNRRRTNMARIIKIKEVIIKKTIKNKSLRWMLTDLP